MDKLTKESMEQEQLVQPEWCDYAVDELGDATSPYLGCWSLLAGRVTSEDFCKSCELYKKQENGQ